MDGMDSGWESGVSLVAAVSVLPPHPGNVKQTRPIAIMGRRTGTIRRERRETRDFMIRDSRRHAGSDTGDGKLRLFAMLGST
jgi:hypothetical protein